MVEHRLAKARVASSNLVFRSIIWRHSQVVRQRTANPSSPVRIRVSPPSIAGVAEQADARDLKSLGHKWSYRFDSGLRHQKKSMSKKEVANITATFLVNIFRSQHKKLKKVLRVEIKRTVWGISLAFAKPAGLTFKAAFCTDEGASSTVGAYLQLVFTIVVVVAGFYLGQFS